MTSNKIRDEHLKRGAVVYIRQSSASQVRNNTESKRLQYALADKARQMGFKSVEVIDQDLGRSGSGLVSRAGFEALVGIVCSQEVGAVFCIEDARLARNGREWHHLIDLCAMTATLLIDPNDVYDPRVANDRLLLGMKGTIAEFELTLFRQRSLEAIRAKAARGELRVRLPTGLQWNDEGRIELDPDRRIQQGVRSVLCKFNELGSARQVLLWFRRNKVSVPVLNQPGTEVLWKMPNSQLIRSMLTNPFYAGAYAFGRTEVRTRLVDGRPYKSQGHRKQIEDWTVLLYNHHPGYLSWEQYERNQRLLAENAHMFKTGHKKSGRGGHALLTGLLRCARCGRRLVVGYKGASNRVPRYSCYTANRNHGIERCISFGGLRVDEAISAELMHVIEPVAVDAAISAAEQQGERQQAQRRALELELEQARYVAGLAERRYEAVDPDKRLVAAELEARWNVALQQVERLESQLRQQSSCCDSEPIDREVLLSLAEDLPSVWNDPAAEPGLKQRIVHILIEEIVADVDRETSEIVLVVHWVGGRHSQLRVQKNKPGHTGRWTDPDAIKTIGCMAGKWPDQQIALTLNRLKIRTGSGLTWTEGRIRAIRHQHKLPAYDPSNAIDDTLSLQQAAQLLCVSTTVVRRLIESRALAAIQVAPGAPWQILREDLEREEVRKEIEAVKSGLCRSRTRRSDIKNPMIPGL